VWQKSRNPEYAGESACATTLDQQFAEQGGAGIQPNATKFFGRDDGWSGREWIAAHPKQIAIDLF
jgi:hypothetical protein